MKIAFYAPMKSPLHAVPSGDRRVGRLLMKALEAAGYNIELASELRSFDKTGDVVFQEDVRRQGLKEADRLIADYKTRPAEDRPVAWFTYHLYHKAPDWIGPRVCSALSIPYLVAEASHAPKQQGGRWGSGYLAAAEAIGRADRVFHMTKLDGECLRPLTADPDDLCYLPPFIDQEKVDLSSDQAEQIIAQSGGQLGKINLLSVAMMRGGDKLESYRQLSQALDFLKGDDWQLIIVGDGDERSQVEAFLEQHKNRIVYAGALEKADLFSLYQKADLYVWPAHGEAYGMAFLEAELNGLPVVAGKIRGVPDVVMDGETGLLSTAGDMQDFANKIRFFMDNPQKRTEMGAAAEMFVKQNRGLEKAARLLGDELQKVIS